jgi:biopolymer transport protein ExbD
MDLKLSGLQGEDDLLVARRPAVEESPRFDITAMVDLVFMMNIFFLVTWVGTILAEIDLPAAEHCMPADPETAVVVTMLGDGSRRPATVYLGDLERGQRLTEPAEIERRVRQAVVEGKRQGKDTLLIKAEKDVRLKDIVRVASAAAEAEGMKLNLAVLEKE